LKLQHLQMWSYKNITLGNQSCRTQPCSSVRFFLITSKNQT